jgi:cardiolipin synthase A/B
MRRSAAIYCALLILLSLLSACSSIPTLVPDMATRPPKGVNIETAKGPLSQKQSQAILAKLQKNNENTNIFEKHLALESEIVDSPLVAGNLAEILIDGPETYEAMFKAIDEARHHINMETFIIEDDEIGQKFARRLIKKQQSGVQINLIYDSFGSSKTPKAFFNRMRDVGINVLEFNPINPLEAGINWDLTRRDHRKLLIVDGHTAFVGGINISSVYSSGSYKKSSKKIIETTNHNGEDPWRDTHLHLKGPAVEATQKLFIETWEEQKGEPLAPEQYYPALKTSGKEVVRIIGSNPTEPYNQMYVTLLSAINSAESQVYITNAYFVPDPQLLTALKEAVMRGVEVSLILPEKTDSNLVYHASRAYFDELLEANVKIYEHQESLLHAKTAVIDGVWSTIGSTNLDWRSFTYNQEINAVILGSDFGAKMDEMFKEDLRASKLLTLKSWRERPIISRVKECAARLWARLL